MGVTKVYRPPLDLADAVRDMTAIATDAAGERPDASRSGGAPFRALSQRLTAIEWDGVQPAESRV